MSFKKFVTDDPVFTKHEYSIDLANLEIDLIGNVNHAIGCGGEDTGEPGVEYTMANMFIKNLRLCMHNARGKNNKLLPILVHMKTCGGDWGEGMAIYDMIKACPNPIIILSYTHARSMSSLILQAADKRILMPTSYFMFHEGDGLVAGTTKQIKTQITFDKRDEEILLGTYARRLRQRGPYKGKAIKTIVKDLKRRMDKSEEVFLNAEAAVREGFADEVFDGNWNRLKEVPKDYQKEIEKDLQEDDKKKYKRKTVGKPNVIRGHQKSKGKDRRKRPSGRV